MRVLTGPALALLFLGAPFSAALAANAPSARDTYRPVIVSETSALDLSEPAAGMFPVPGFDFRNASWLMEHDAVRSSEDLPILSDDARILTRVTSIQGLEVVLGYFFGDDGLFEGGAYFFQLGGGNTRRQVAAYRMVRASLLSTFGTPLTMENPSAWSDKLNWVKTHLDAPLYGGQARRIALFHCLSQELIRLIY